MPRWNETTIFNTWKISYHFLNFVRFQNSFKLFFHSIGHPRSISRYSRKICVRKGREKKERRRSEGSLPPRKQGMSIRDLMTFGQRRGREKGFLPVSINGGAATKGAARKSFGSFQPSSRPLVEKERRERERERQYGQKRRGTMEGSAAVQATNYKSIVTLIFSPGVLPALTTERRNEKRDGKREGHSLCRLVAVVMPPLSRHCRDIVAR